MKEKSKRACALALSAVILSPAMPAVLSGCGEEEDIDGISAFSLGEVTATDDYLVNGLKKEIEYLLKLDADRLLAGFYMNAGLPTSAEMYTGGWEGALIGGHTMGHYLSALAQAYANAGTDGESREELSERIAYVVDCLRECQENSKGKFGFIWGAKSVSSRAEAQFDYVEQGRANIVTEAWVPWYTMHKIIAGLVDVYNLTGNKTALTVASDLGTWVYDRVSKWDDNTQKTVLSIEYGGMNDCMYNLYAITGDEEHAIAAHMFDEESLFKKVLLGEANYLDNLHANTTIPKIIGALNRFVVLQGKTIDGEKVDAEEMIEVAEAFWDRVVNHHSYVTGGNSEWEHFGRDDILDGERTGCNDETCNVYNMLKLSRMLFEITGEKKYLDYYENAYLNSILSSQNPKTGMTTYFQPMATGYFKVYSTEETNFWCCTGSGMESFSKLNDSIYYHTGNEVIVALYLDSTLNWEKKGVVIRQTADLENSDEVTFTVEKGNTVMQLRIPDWTASYTVKVNGNEREDDKTDGFFRVEVKKGDVVTVLMKKTVTAHGLPDNANVYAFKYGPYVLSAELGSENMSTTTTGVNVTVPARAIVDSQNISVTATTAEKFITNIGDYLTKGEDGKFRLSGTDTELTYSVHYRQYTQRYGIYFYFVDGDYQEKEEAYTKEIIDTVQPGYGQYENDELHDMQETDSVSVTNDGTYRYAKAGGSFTYTMKVEKGVQNHLIFTLRASDNGKTLKVKSGDTLIYEETLGYYGGLQSYQVMIPIPAEVVAAATEKTANGESCFVIPITFSSANDGESAKVCDFIYTAKITFNGERDSKIAYFVDCGDYDPITVSDGDHFGMYNSVTEQVFGLDTLTGKHWGILDNPDPSVGTAGADCPMGIATANTWAYEFNKEDGLDKTTSNRYTKNQYEQGVARNMSYKFELDDGDYTVKMYFSDPWNCSANPCVDANGDTMIYNGAVNREISFSVTVEGGYLVLDITSDDKCINLCYIIIEFA